jgi:Protein of unknown function (DUF1573)
MKLFSLAFVVAITLMSCNSKDSNSSGGVSKDGFVGGGDTTNIITPVDSTKWTEIQWIDTLKDLGDLTADAPVEVVFRFKNVGKNPLSINSVVAGCGCTEPKKPAGLTKPGEEGIVKATFKTSGQNGQVQKSITVICNTQQNNYQLAFKAKVSPKK